MATYNVGDYVKVEFPYEATGISEWMWLRVSRCDEEKELAFGTLFTSVSSVLVLALASQLFRSPSNPGSFESCMRSLPSCSAPSS